MLQSSLRAEGEAIQRLQRRLDCFVGLWPPRNDRGAFGLRVQCSNRHCEPKAKQSSGCKEDWIASSAFGLLAMTVEPLASASNAPIVIASRRRSNPAAAKKTGLLRRPLASSQ